MKKDKEVNNKKDKEVNNLLVKSKKHSIIVNRFIQS